MFRFEKLEVWRSAIEYGKECYAVAQSFPSHERYALGDQLRRAAVSISNNIAEGSVGSRAIFQEYLVTAIGSTLETVNILNFAGEIGYIDKQAGKKLYEKAEVLIKRLRTLSRVIGSKPLAPSS